MYKIYQSVDLVINGSVNGMLLVHQAITWVNGDG